MAYLSRHLSASIIYVLHDTHSGVDHAGPTLASELLPGANTRFGVVARAFDAYAFIFVRHFPCVLASALPAMMGAVYEVLPPANSPGYTVLSPSVCSSRCAMA